MNGAINFRPVGHLPGVFRSGDPTAIGPAAAARLRTDPGIVAFVDLRTDLEVERSGPPLGLLSAEIAWVRCPIETRDSEAISGASPGPAAYGRYYFQLLESSAGAVNRALAAIAEHLPSPVAFGCFAGKDRTGVVAALLLELSGAPFQIIAEDYAASERHLFEAFEHFAPKWQKRGITAEEYSFHLRTSPETMELLYQALHGNTLLTHMRRRGLDPLLETRLSALLREK